MPASFGPPGAIERSMRCLRQSPHLDGEHCRWLVGEPDAQRNVGGCNGTFAGTPAMPTNADVAERWRSLAGEARAAADGLTDPEAKRIMLNIADGYQLLARRAEARKKDQKNS